MHWEKKSKRSLEGAAKSFVRHYAFLAQVLTYGRPEWEKLSIFLKLLERSLKTPEEDGLARRILEAVNMDSYRAEKHASSYC